MNPYSLRTIAKREVNIAGGKRKTFCAYLGTPDDHSTPDWLVTGSPSKDQAIESLHQTLQRQARWMYTKRYFRKGSVTFALSYRNGWEYDIVRDDGVFSTAMLSKCTHEEALNRMLRHIEQHDGL